MTRYDRSVRNWLQRLPVFASIERTSRPPFRWPQTASAPPGILAHGIHRESEAVRNVIDCQLLPPSRVR